MWLGRYGIWSGCVCLSAWCGLCCMMRGVWYGVCVVWCVECVVSGAWCLCCTHHGVYGVSMMSSAVLVWYSYFNRRWFLSVYRKTYSVSCEAIACFIFSSVSLPTSYFSHFAHHLSCVSAGVLVGGFLVRTAIRISFRTQCIDELHLWEDWRRAASAAS